MFLHFCLTFIIIQVHVDKKFFIKLKLSYMILSIFTFQCEYTIKYARALAAGCTVAT